jgi:signal peptidase I
MIMLRKIVRIVLAIALFAVIVGFYSVKRVIVHGISMEPSFHTGQTVFVWTSVPTASLNIGDVIVLHSNDGDELIKRIVFIQNEQGTNHPPPLVWTPDGDKPFNELFDNYAGLDSTAPGEDRRIWVMGDNYEHSEDSRDFGPIAPKQILGKVIK